MVELESGRVAGTAAACGASGGLRAVPGAPALVASALLAPVRPRAVTTVGRAAYRKWLRQYPDQPLRADEFTVDFRSRHGHGPSLRQLGEGMGWTGSREVRSWIVAGLVRDGWLTNTGATPWTLRPGSSAQEEGVCLPAGVPTPARSPVAVADPGATVEAMWRALDLLRPYLGRDRAGVAATVRGLSGDQEQHLLAWLVLDRDALAEELGMPAMELAQADAVASLAPAEAELAVTTVLRRVTREGVSFVEAVADLAPVNRVHALAVRIAVMLLEAYGSEGAQAHLDAAGARYVRHGHPRPE
ncbi:hypothetical protein [Streptomyces bohaiensis]|uniref:hypothetical protein n=1 Tax=Streptomyces bohaiensis TaxID=1431344 RepID=UPI003B803BCF